MITISKPVGMTAKAANLRPDVITIQKSLNGVPDTEGGPRIPLVVDGIAGPKTNGAIQQFQLHHFGRSISDGRVDPGGPTLRKLNEVSAENVTVTRVTAVGGTVIPPLGNPNIVHIVTLRGAGSVTLRATITPTHAVARAAITWDGATPSPADPLVATLPKFPARKQVVQIKKADGTVIQEIRVWVLWCTITGGTTGVQVLATDAGASLEIAAPWSFMHWITPVSIVTDADRPALDGPNVSSVPGAAKIHVVNGNTLAGGATLKWDASRQIRTKVTDPQGHLTGVVTQQLAYPVDDVEGNDDTHPGDEDNNPYDNPNLVLPLPFTGPITIDRRDHLESNDRPRLRVPHTMGGNGDTIDLRFHFREFARIELAGTWFRISDFFLWRFHMLFRRAGGNWQDNGSDTAANNAGF